MKRDALLIYGDRLPLPVVLEHERFRSCCKAGLELRRAAARALNHAMVDARLTRGELSSRLGVSYEALSRVCKPKHSMDVELLKLALRHLDRDWRETTVYFAAALDYRRAPRAAGEA